MPADRPAAARDDDDEDENDRTQRVTKALAAGDTRATRCAGGRRPATQSSMIAGQRATTKRAADKSKQKTNHCALKTGERRPAERAVSNQKGKDDADKERTSEEEEDYNNNEEEDCVAANATAAAAAVPAAATAAATAGRHASSAATACDQAVAAVAAAWRSGLRWCMVAAATDSRMPSLTPVFFVFS